MAKKIKVIRRRKFSITKTIRNLFILSAVLFVTSALFLRTYNVNLSVAMQKTQKKIIEVHKTNQTLASDKQEHSA